MATKTKVSKRLSKPEKITNEELNKIQNLIDSANRAQMQVGKIEVQKNNILNQISAIQNQIALFRDEVRKNYGTDDIDIQTGEINYNKDEQTNKKD
jgi:conjugal transfer/entry exclusion protein